MKKIKSSTIEVQGTAIAIVSGNDGDYISLTDMLRAKDGEFFISDWLRNRNTVEFLGIWESVFNPAFNYGEFATIKSQAGRYGGTYAHPASIPTPSRPSFYRRKSRPRRPPSPTPPRPMC